MKNNIRNLSIFILSAVMTLSCGCNTIKTNTPEKPVSIRLASNYNSDWAVDAIGSLDVDKMHKVPLIAVIDTGSDTQSPNIINRYNAVDNNKDTKDNCEHGTYITSKLLQLNRNANLVIIKVTDNAENITEENLAKGIRKAVELNANIINISLGTSNDYPQIQKAIKEAVQKNILVIASAGNSGKNLMYPAKYDDVISVMARDINNFDLSENSRSKEKKSFSAPGEHILCENEYVTGTSIATVYITNAVSYIKSKNMKLKCNEIYDLLEKACRYPTDYTNGLIDYNLLKNLF